jgi:putative glycosyltransferase
MIGIVVQWMFIAEPVSGWTSLIVSLWLIGSMVISFIGVIGIYLAKILSEVKRRPYTIVREVHGGEPR